jgi:nitrate reductase gamma subunit
VHPIFKAHLVLGMTILLVFPFTRLVHMLSAPIWYLNRRGWQLVRTKRALPLRRVAAAPVYPTVALNVVPKATVQAVRPKSLTAAE